jgi:hypothetical protein
MDTKKKKIYSALLTFLFWFFSKKKNNVNINLIRKVIKKYKMDEYVENIFFNMNFFKKTLTRKK